MQMAGNMNRSNCVSNLKCQIHQVIPINMYFQFGFIFTHLLIWTGFQPGYRIHYYVGLKYKTILIAVRKLRRWVIITKQAIDYFGIDKTWMSCG